MNDPSLITGKDQIWSPNPSLKHIANTVQHDPVQPTSVLHKGDEIIIFIFISEVYESLTLPHFIPVKGYLTL